MIRHRTDGGLVPQRLKHVTIRDGVFQYQRRVPKTVVDRHDAFELFFRGRVLYRKSLRTSSYSEALARASAVEIEFDGLVAAATGQVSPSMRQDIQVRRTFDANALGRVSMQVRDSIVRDWRRTIVRAEVDPTAADYLRVRIDDAISRQEASGDPLMGVTDGASIGGMARSLNAELGFQLDERSTAYAELIRAVSDGCVQAREDVQTLLLGKSLPDKPSSALIRDFTPSTGGGAGPMFSVVASNHLKVNNFAPKTVEKALRAHQRFVEVIGDKPVREVSRQDIHRFVEAVAAQEVGGAAGHARSVSRGTVQSYVSQISSRLSFAISRGFHDGPNPAVGINLAHWVADTDPVKTPPKRRFEIAELNSLFMHPWFNGCSSLKEHYVAGEYLLEDMRYWAPVLALYTGARAAELGGLRVSDVMLVGTPHILLRPNEYRRIKRGTRRVVPIVDALIDLGFDRYVERTLASGADRLFPDWICPASRSGTEDDELSRWANSRWIRAFNRTVIPKLFERQPLATRSELTFHSLRGAFKKLMIDHGNDKKANAVIGHSQDAIDRAYIGHFSPEELHKEFRSANYEGLAITGR